MPIGDEVDQLVDLVRQFVEALAMLASFNVAFPQQVAESLGDTLASVGEPLIAHETSAEFIDQSQPDDTLPNGERVRTRSALLVRFAAVVNVSASTRDNHLAATHAATEQAAEQVGALSSRHRTTFRRAICAPRVEAPNLSKPLLRGVPCLLVNDAELRTLRDDSASVVLAHRHTSIRSGNFAPLRHLVAPPTEIALVVQHGADGRILPANPATLHMDARRFDTVVVQGLRDFVERVALQIKREDASYDFGLVFADLDLGPGSAPVRGKFLAQAVAERHASRGKTCESPPLEAAQCLVAEIAQVDARHQRLHAERERGMARERVDAVCHADEAHLQKLEHALNGEKVGGRAGQPRQVFNDDDVELARPARSQPHHSLVGRAIATLSTLGAVGEDPLVA